MPTKRPPLETTNERITKDSIKPPNTSSSNIAKRTDKIIRKTEPSIKIKKSRSRMALIKECDKISPKAYLQMKNFVDLCLRPTTTIPKDKTKRVTQSTLWQCYRNVFLPVTQQPRLLYEEVFFLYLSRYIFKKRSTRNRYEFFCEIKTENFVKTEENEQYTIGTN